MPRAAFKQCEVQRLLRAAKAEGYANPGVEVRSGGALVLLTDAPSARADAAGEGGNEWDEVLQPPE